MLDPSREEAEIVLRLSKITKKFGPLLANDAISFTLRRGEVISLLGENGAGKTTLMNILFGHYVADEGDVEVLGSVLPKGDPATALDAGIGMVHQHFTLADQMSVIDNIALGTQRLFSWRFDSAKARARITKLADEFGLEVNPDALVSELSVGERQRVEILKALYRDARILILDEPTAVLTPLETEALFRTLRKLVADGLSIIFISHKLGEVMAVSDRVLVLRGGKLVGERKAADTDRTQLATLMVGDEVIPPDVVRQKPGKPLFELKAISTLAAHGLPALNQISLTLRGGEITGLAGVSGNGQAALASLIAGTLAPVAGSIVIDEDVISTWSAQVALKNKIGRIPEDRHAVGMIGDMSVTENIISETYQTRRFSRWGLLDWRRARDFATQIITNYDVKCPSPEAYVRLLSGGNMQKLILGRALDGDPDIIIANQPSRGLDVGAVAYVHARLLDARQRGAAILLISEDLEEVMALSDCIIAMSKGRLSTPSMRGARSIADLGELMAGHGFALEDDADAA